MGSTPIIRPTPLAPVLIDPGAFVSDAPHSLQAPNGPQAPNSPQGPQGGPARPVAVPVLAAAAAIAGLLQLIAGVALGLASPEALHRAARAGPRATILLVLALAGCGLLAWLLRQRTAVAAGLGLAGPLLAAIVWWKGGLTKLALAYHGEFILHHFLALVCAALCLAIPLQWIRDPRLAATRLRWLPAVPATLGALLLLAEHLLPASHDADLTGPFGQVGAALSLATWPLALALLWPTLGPTRLRAWLLVSTTPALVRLALGGAAALAGVPLGLAAATPVMTTVVVASLLGLPLLRPQLDRVLQLVVSIGAGVMTMGLHRVYLQRFGDLEGDLGGLVRSLFGFDLPYPGYVPGWRLAAAMLGLFVLLTTVSGALISQRDHIRGLGLALMISAGLGLASPQLVLMLCAGYLVLLDATAGAPPDPEAVVAAPPPAPLGPTLTALATRLELPAPVSLEQREGLVLALRGDLDHVALHLRARETRRGWQVELTLGVPGRGRPEVELLPGADGHRVLGNTRRLETLPEPHLIAHADHPTHHLKLWPGGVHLDFGRQLGGLDVDRLARLLAQLGRVV